MALWARVQQLNGDAMRQIQLVYGVHFPIEVRHFFANWIEDQHWYASTLFSEDINTVEVLTERIVICFYYCVMTYLNC